MRSVSKKLIIEKKESQTSQEVLKLFGKSGKLELLDGKNIDDILKAYENDKDSIIIIIFHASGRDNVTPEKASEYLEKLLNWKDEKTQLFTVSEGVDHRTKMKEKIVKLRAKNSYVDSYPSFLNKLRETLNKVKSGKSSK